MSTANRDASALTRITQARALAQFKYVSDLSNVKEGGFRGLDGSVVAFRVDGQNAQTTTGLQNTRIVVSGAGCPASTTTN